MGDNMNAESHQHGADKPTRARLQLAARIRVWREARGLSQAELAEKAGFARSTLSKIENGLLSPTFEILLKIARGFGVDLSELVRTEAVPLTSRMQVVRVGTGDAIRYDNHLMLPLAAGLKDRAYQCAVVTFTARDLAAFGPWNRHDTEDMLYVLDGKLAFHSQGYDPVVLVPGDSLHFDGTMPHACLAVGEAPCLCLYVFAQR
jgi:transcriptional regulator with XRE-family HTH domain